MSRAIVMKRAQTDATAQDGVNSRSSGSIEFFSNLQLNIGMCESMYKHLAKGIFFGGGHKKEIRRWVAKQLTLLY